MIHPKISDLPEHVRRCICTADRAALGLPASNPEHNRETLKPEHNRETQTRQRQPNKTEQEYNRAYLSSLGKYEALSFKLANGHRYTPDWVTVSADGQITAHEVKGSYKFHSEGRSMLAFDQATLEWPTIRFVWARRTREGWKVF